MKLLRVVEVNSNGVTSEPIECVCYHPFAIKKLQNGEPNVKPLYCATTYEYESILAVFIATLGWQGGTLDDALAEIKRLKELEKNENDLSCEFNGRKEVKP